MRRAPDIRSNFGAEKSLPKKVPVVSPNKWNINSIEFINLKVLDLKQACKKMGMISSGKKAELVERLMGNNKGFLPVMALPDDIAEPASSSSSAGASGNVIPTSDQQAKLWKEFDDIFDRQRHKYISQIVNERSTAPHMDIATLTNTVSSICVPLSVTPIVGACNDSVCGNMTHNNCTNGGAVVTVSNSIKIGGVDGGMPPYYLQPHSLLQNRSPCNQPGCFSLASSSGNIASLVRDPSSYRSFVKSKGIASNSLMANENTIPTHVIPLSSSFVYVTPIASAFMNSSSGDIIHNNSTTGGTTVTSTNITNKMGRNDGNIAPYCQQLQLHSLLQNQPSGNKSGHSSLSTSSSQYTASLLRDPPSCNSDTKFSVIASSTLLANQNTISSNSISSLCYHSPISATVTVRAKTNCVGGGMTHTNSTSLGTMVTFTNSTNQVGGSDRDKIYKLHSPLQNQPAGYLHSSRSTPDHPSLPASLSQHIASLFRDPHSYSSYMKSSGIARSCLVADQTTISPYSIFSSSSSTCTTSNIRAKNASASGGMTYTNPTTGGTVATFTNSTKQKGRSDGGIALCYQQLQLHSLLKNQSPGNRLGLSSLPVSSDRLIASLSIDPPSYNSVMQSNIIESGYQSYTGLASPLDMYK